MGFFENLGRKVERFKQEAAQTAEAQAGYACRECGARFHTEQATCPECGSDDVIEREVDTDDVDGEDSAVDGADGNGNESADREGSADDEPSSAR